ncbi:DUF2744 domain-containing protein [Nocardia sp. NPDC057440]|uniref:phage gene 29 protein family protein n=1 Tax=Nocardia sp. NPDC057440 TaxID=3346134 RepID=UPI00366F0FA1
MDDSAQRFPQQKDCDPTDPEQHFLWALTQIPYNHQVTQPVQPRIARVMSKHLYELGFRHHPQLQSKKLQMPYRGQQHTLNGMSVWVPMDSEAPEPPPQHNVKAMTREEQEVLKKELEDVGLIQPPQRHLGRTAEIVSYKQLKSDHVVRARDILLGENGGTEE